MTDQTKPPLWRVMDWSVFAETYYGSKKDRPIDLKIQDRCCGEGLRKMYDAEIRAVAEWIESLGRGPHHFIHPSHIASLLRAEADRAERGD